MQTTFPARFPLEMLDDIREEDFLPIDFGRLQRLIEQRSCRSDKGMPCFVLKVAGRFSDYDHARRLGSLA